MATESNFYILSGSEDLRRIRFLRKLIQEKRDAGWRIEKVDASEPGSLEGALEGNMLFAADHTFVVVENPEKADLDVLTSHRDGKDMSVWVLLHIDGDPKGNTKFGKFVTECKKHHRAFKSPAEWDADKEAVKFALEEATKECGKSLDEKLAVALVQKVGSELGMVAFELKKAATLADLAQSPSIEIDHIKGALAPIAEASLQPVLDALASKRTGLLLRMLLRFEQGAKGDQTMRVCRFLGPRAIQWMQAASLLDKPAQEAASIAGINPWYFANKVLPTARLWGLQGCIRLIEAIARAERALLSGVINPWIVLETNLVSACRA